MKSSDEYQWLKRLAPEVFHKPAEEITPEMEQDLVEAFEQAPQSRELLAFTLFYRDSYTLSQVGKMVRNKKDPTIPIAAQTAHRLVLIGYRRLNAAYSLYKDRGQKGTKNSPIKFLQLPTMVSNSLARAGIETVGELLQCEWDELLTLRNLGRKGLETINQALKKNGYPILPGSPATITPVLTENSPIGVELRNVFQKLYAEIKFPINQTESEFVDEMILKIERDINNKINKPKL